MAMMTMTGPVRPWEPPAIMQRNRSAWCERLDSVIEARARNTEHDIAEYLHRHQHHLPPEVRIALERHVGRGDWR
jgi:hypothetical protein